MKKLLLVLLMLLISTGAWSDSSTIGGYESPQVNTLEFIGFTGAPGVSGTGIAKLYFNRIDGKLYVSLSTGAWAEFGSSGAPADADFLVGTANGDLSAEIVVGATPGGELGNTWASPTVNATHAGSDHNASVSITFDGGGSAIVADTIWYGVIPYGMTLKSWYLVSDQSGSIQIDIWVDAFGQTPVDADSITNGHEPAIVGNSFASDTNITDWSDVTMTATNQIAVNVDSITTVEKATLVILYDRP